MTHKLPEFISPWKKTGNHCCSISFTQSIAMRNPSWSPFFHFRCFLYALYSWNAIESTLVFFWLVCPSMTYFWMGDRVLRRAGWKGPQKSNTSSDRCCNNLLAPKTGGGERDRIHAGRIMSIIVPSLSLPVCLMCFVRIAIFFLFSNLVLFCCTMCSLSLSLFQRSSIPYWWQW